ncbi:MAG: FAD-binding protein [Gammaproteobacteria bacterium]|jgi:glycolate oxidase|nr:FAD-binding protein [Gammaproteobacteria bacterium]MDH3848533.1 FAD-binding protein [Gammaproteobacteria bacterium]MDH3953596.1 FAD-binding protein [Gammaproteobacteria bacterium]MDH4005152.1 FAD-binding protein [Gammaproteobacteria bacterium]NCF60330.1 FAD-binding protein [Gammaproteobacteria bacterium]
MDTAALAAMFRDLVDAQYVVAADESKRPYECDGLSVYKEMPGLVVMPSSTEEVRAIMRLCHRRKVPVVVRGAGTGLSGGALPNPNGVLLSLARLSRILQIDPEAGLARVQPGVTNLAISEACAPYGLFYAPDPSSQIACSIGGNVAENAGGVHCLKYGLTVHNVVQLTVVTVEGEIITVGCEGLASAGPDLMALVIGSEGMLGVVTEVTVRLLPVPSHCQVILASFDELEHAGDAVSAVIAEGIIPAGFEMMDSHAIRAAEDYVGAGYDTDAEALLLCELDGTEEEVRYSIEQVTEVFRGHGARSIRVSQNEAERLLFWKGRKSAFPAVGRISPDYYCMDGTIPRRSLSRVLSEISRLSHEYGLRVANVFHAGDGNLHPLILFDESKPGELQKAEAFGAEILRLCVAAGGCITGEHGVGVEKLPQMLDQFSDAELAQLNAIKDALDPDALLNPGKGVPTLKRCQEYRST